MSSSVREATSRKPNSNALIAIPTAELRPSSAIAMAVKPTPPRKPNV